MTHLTFPELVDAIEERLAPERRAHLHDCEHCREQVAHLASVLVVVRDVDVPEPSPLFWEQLSDRVQRVIAADAPSPPRPARWFEWPVLVPLGALGLLVFALVSTVPKDDEIQGAQLAMAGSETMVVNETSNGDAHWALMDALVGDVDFDAAEDAGMSAAPGTAEDVVWQLTSAEQQELVRLLRAELQRSGG